MLKVFIEQGFLCYIFAHLVVIDGLWNICIFKISNTVFMFDKEVSSKLSATKQSFSSATRLFFLKTIDSSMQVSS